MEISSPYFLIKEVLKSHKKVLDIGSGPLMHNLTEFYFMGHFEKLVAIDRKEKSLTFPNSLSKLYEFDLTKAIKISKTNFEYKKLNITKDKIQLSESFDVIILCQFLHFLDKEQRTKIISWCIANLNDQGILFIRANHTANEKIKNYAAKTECIKNEIKYCDENGDGYYLFEPEDLSINLSELINLNHLNERTEEYFTIVYKKNDNKFFVV